MIVCMPVYQISKLSALKMMDGSLKVCLLLQIGIQMHAKIFFYIYLEPESDEEVEVETLETEISEECDPGFPEESIVQPGPSCSIQKVPSKKSEISEFLKNHSLTEKSNISWKKIDNFVTPQINWHADIDSATELQSPAYFFGLYFTDSLFELMAEKTNLFTVQNCTRFSPTNVDEMKTFVGIHILMGNLHYPRIRFYWDSQLRISQISEAMPVNRFSSLRANLHFVDVRDLNAADEINKDRFWKVRPLYNFIRARCLSLTLETYLSIDEQMVPFKGRLNVKQYVKNKPKPWGIKIFALCGVSGTLYDFIIYQGSTTELDKTQLAVFGQGAAVVLKLSNRIKEPNFQLYFDNYFSNYQLLQYLKHKNIFATCTARIDRFSHPPFSSDNDMKKQGRGVMEQVISPDGVVLTKWFDNKAVVVASNFMGIGETDICRRWDKKTKEYVEVPRPEVIKNYNANMGGIDKMDFLITIYRTFIRSRKWTLRMFTHAIDIACVNAWCEYKKRATVLGVEKKNILDLVHFRSYVAEVLMKANKTPSRKRGRPAATMPDENTPKRPKPSAARRPLEEVRLDNIGHLPSADEDYGNRCKFPSCKGKTCFRCVKCNIHLCLSKKSNCFLKYHTER